MKTNNRQKIKRLAVNLAAFLVIAAVVILGVYLQDLPKTFTGQDIGLPALKNKIAPDGVRVDLETGSIQIALRLDSDGKVDDSHAADMMTLYRLGREYFRPIKCGLDYPPNLCVVGKVEFIFVDATKTMSEEGLPQVSLFKVFLLGLDQVQIDKLLLTNPTTIQELIEFHMAAGEDSGGTGTFYEEFENEPYLGLNNESES